MLIGGGPPIICVGGVRACPAEKKNTTECQQDSALIVLLKALRMRLEYPTGDRQV